MAKAFAFVISSVLLLVILGVCEGLVCYHCFSQDVKSYEAGTDFVPCNEANLPASNTHNCPSPDCRCIYRVVYNTFSNSTQIWRTFSINSSNPCDPSGLPPGVKNIRCTHCNTDKCNLQEGVIQNQNTTFTFNINANVNLYIRQ